MKKTLKQLIDEKIFGIKSEREIDKVIRVWSAEERRRKLVLKRYDSLGSRLRRLLVNDNGLGWSWRAWLKYLLG